MLERFVELVSAALSESGVLSVLQSLQATGDAWDVEGIIKLHNSLLSAEHKGLDLTNHHLTLSLGPEGTNSRIVCVVVCLALLQMRRDLAAPLRSGRH